MAKGEHLRKYQFKKGQTGNPNGRPKKIYTVIKQKGFGKTDIATAFQELAWYTIEELKSVFEDPGAPAILKVAASAIKKAIEEGDLKKVREILEYTMGKPKQRLEHTGEDGAPITFDTPASAIDYTMLSDDVLKAIAKARKQDNPDEQTSGKKAKK